MPTAVFSPLEYGCTGLSEEDAVAKFGEDNIEVYHQQFKPLELTLPGRGDNASYVKVTHTHTHTHTHTIMLPGRGPNASY